MSRDGRKTGGGSRKGKPNKATATIKEMILGALSDVGGREYLTRQALENPGSFMTLIGKVLPTQITGADNGPIQIEDITARRAAARALLDETFGPIIDHEPLADGSETATEGRQQRETVRLVSG